MEKIYDIIVIGGGPSGLSTGIYAGRAQLDTLIIEKSDFGGQIRTTSEVVNYPGIKDISGHSLGEQMREQALNFGVEFLKDEVLKINLDNEIKEVITKSGIYKTLSIVISTGASPRKLGFIGEKEFTGRGVAYCATCDGEFFKGLEVFVIGAGFAAAEEAIFLTKFAKKVTVIAREPEFTCAKSISDKVLAHPKIETHFNTEILEAMGDTKLRKAKFINNKTKEIWDYSLENNETFGIFVFIGYQPQSEIFKGQIDLDNYGYILTDENLETSAKDVYAVGDVRPKKLRQVVTAVADGALAATTLEKIIEEKRERLELKREIKVKKSSVEISEIKEENFHKKYLDESLVEQLKGIFEKLENNIKIIAILDEKEISQNIKDFLEEIISTSSKISLQIYNKNENLVMEEKIKLENSPTIAILDKTDNFTGIKFSGLPSGHELNSFVLAIYNVAGPGQNLDENLREKIKNIPHNINLKIAVSLSCALCPEVVMNAQRLAVENKNITAEMIDIFSYQKIKDKYNLMGVPALIVNDQDVYFGKQSIEEILEKLLEK